MGDQARSEHALPVVRRIHATIAIARGPSEVPPDLLRDLFQRWQALRQQHPVGLIDGRHGDGRSHRALMVNEGNDLRALLGFVP